MMRGRILRRVATITSMGRREGSSFVTWLNYVSSAIGVPGVVYNATTAGTDGSLFPLLSPFAGVRMQSTGVTGGTLTMKVIQPDGF